MIFNKKNHEERVAKVLDQLADTVLQLSDEEMAAEVCEDGADPEQEAESTRSMLRDCVTLFDNVNERLWHLGHTIDPSDWRRGTESFYVYCLACGELVTLAIATSEARGHALRERCPNANRYKITQTASG
jgi:hypothetical protein